MGAARVEDIDIHFEMKILYFFLPLKNKLIIINVDQTNKINKCHIKSISDLIFALL